MKVDIYCKNRSIRSDRCHFPALQWPQKPPKSHKRGQPKSGIDPTSTSKPRGIWTMMDDVSSEPSACGSRLVRSFRSYLVVPNSPGLDRTRRRAGSPSLLSSSSPRTDTGAPEGAEGAKVDGRGVLINWKRPVRSW